MQLSAGMDLQVSGDRFMVIYQLTGVEQDAYNKAKDICLEQTVEFPGELVPEGPLKEHIVGHIESFEREACGTYRAVISYAVETASAELTQLFNVIFGNTSIKQGIRVVDFTLPASLLAGFSGPRWGQEGIRRAVGISHRPLLFTALKPMGLSVEELADFAYQFALGGVDIIKDDHGLSNQSFSPFEDRVRQCVAAVNRANEETGSKSIYVPNITAPCSQLMERARLARDLGAGGLLISPGLTGFDAMRAVAEDDGIDLPLFSHPAFLGSYVFGDSGISHGALFGRMNRLAGADAAIYPNFGGRFSFSRQECEEITVACSDDMGGFPPIFPCPAGGMSLESIPASLKVYGKEVVFLVGGGLFQQGPDLVENSRYFRKMIEDLVSKDQ